MPDQNVPLAAAAATDASDREWNLSSFARTKAKSCEGDSAIYQETEALEVSTGTRDLVFAFGLSAFTGLSFEFELWI